MKFGNGAYNTVDNGVLLFNNVHIPRDQMLMRFVQSKLTFSCCVPFTISLPLFYFFFFLILDRHHVHHLSLITSIYFGLVFSCEPNRVDMDLSCILPPPSSSPMISADSLNEGCTRGGGPIYIHLLGRESYSIHQYLNSANHPSIQLNGLFHFFLF